MRRLFTLVILLLLGGVGVSGQSAPLLQQAQFRYLGSFLVQNIGGNAATWTGYGGQSLAATGDVLYFGGVDPDDRLCRVRIPTDLSGKSVAQLIPSPGGACFELAGIRNLGSGGAVNPVGALVYNNKLIVAAHVYYDASNGAIRSHQRMNLDGTSQLPGFATVGTFGSGQITGAMAHVPPEWQSLLGCKSGGGGGGFPIVGRTSYGPSFYCFDMDQIGSGAVPATRLMAFTQDHPACGPKGCDSGTSPANPYFNWTTNYKVYALPAGYRTFVVVGKHGAGPSCYGEAWECGTTGYKGTHAPPYVQRVWLYETNHLVEVKAGKRQPWDLKPYSFFDLKEPTQNRSDERFGGGAYDPVTRRIYLADIANNDSEQPRVHVYEITGATAPPPEEICGNKIDDDKDGQIDEGCPIHCEVGPWVKVLDGAWSQCFAGPPPFQTRTTLWRRTKTVTEQNGGTCGLSLEENRSETQACTVTPPLGDRVFPGTILSIDRLAGGTWFVKVWIDGQSRDEPYFLTTGSLLDPPIVVGGRIIMTVPR